MNVFNAIVKKYKHIKYKIWNWFEYKSPIYICFNPFKFYSDWWKARKVFHKPILCKYKMDVNENNLGSDYWFAETSTYNKWLMIKSHPCEYKLKFGEIRFESVPYLVIIWRNKTKWIFGLEAPLYDERMNYKNKKYLTRNNLLYWESILTYLWEYNKDIIKTYENNIWTQTFILEDVDKEKGIHKKITKYETILPCLKNKYADIIYKYINNSKEELS